MAQPNRVRNKLSLQAEGKLLKSLKRTKLNSSLSPQEKTMGKERDNVRDETLKALKDASQNMIKRELKHNPPSLHHVGVTVLVRVAKIKKTVKGKKTT